MFVIKCLWKSQFYKIYYYSKVNAALILMESQVAHVTGTISPTV